MKSSKAAIIAGSIAGAVAAGMLMAKKRQDNRSPIQKIIDQLGL